MLAEVITMRITRCELPGTFAAQESEPELPELAWLQNQRHGGTISVVRIRKEFLSVHCWLLHSLVASPDLDLLRRKTISHMFYALECEELACDTKSPLVACERCYTEHASLTMLVWRTKRRFDPSLDSMPDRT
jgi:hypothetical protein